MAVTKPQGVNLITQSVASQGISKWSPSSFDFSGNAWAGAVITTSGEFIELDATGTATPPIDHYATYQSIAVSPGTIYTFYVEYDYYNSIAYAEIKTNTGSVYAAATLTDGAYSYNWTCPAGVSSVNVRIRQRDGGSNVGGGYTFFTNVYFGEYVPATPDTPTPPPPDPGPGTETPFDVTLEVEDVSASVGENLVTNPNGAESAFGWTANTSGPVITTSGSGDWTFLKFIAFTQQNTYYTNDYMPVTPNWYLGLRTLWGGFSAATRIGLQIDYYTAAKAFLSSSGSIIVDPAAAVDNEYNKVVQIPASAEYAKVRFTQYRWNGSSNVNPWSNDYFEAREVTVLTDPDISKVSNIQSWQAETSITWVDILGDSHEISIDRDALNSGLMSAVVIKNEYDPAVGGFLSPGAAVRVRTRDGAVWTNIFQGTLTNVKTTYPRGEETRIAVTANDSLALLANQKESRGIYDVDNLPFILSDKGVKWSINGDANQVASAPIASNNDNASVLDQIVISRDSDKAYAWIDADNVLQVWNRSLLSTAPIVTYTDVATTNTAYDSYNDIDVSFDTSNCINVIETTYVRTDGTEVKYGPYVDAESLKRWGAYKSTFTLHGLSETTSNLQAFANEVFAKNAEPIIKANSITVPVKDERGRSHAAAVDLYSMVGVVYSDKVNDEYRVTAIRHNITPRLWIAEYTFEKGDSVAVPVWTPSVNA